MRGILFLLCLCLSHTAIAQIKARDVKKLNKYEAYLEEGKIYKASKKADKFLEKYPSEAEVIDFFIRTKIELYKESFGNDKNASVTVTSKVVRGIWFKRILGALDTIRVNKIHNNQFCYYLNFLEDYGYESPYNKPPTTLNETYGTRLQVLRKYCLINGQIGNGSGYGFSSDSLAAQLYNQGYDAFQERDFTSALNYYKKAIDQDTSFIEAYDNLGLTYRMQEDFKSAKYYYLKSIERYPQGNTAHQNLAVVYELEENLNEALKEYQILKAINKKDPEGYYGCARVFLMKQQYEPALNNGLKAIEYYGDHKNYQNDANFLVGLCYYYMGDLAEAAPHLQLAKNGGYDVPRPLIEELQLK
jgi:tetratricopeptide (TPR) repeat protein